MQAEPKPEPNLAPEGTLALEPDPEAKPEPEPAYSYTTKKYTTFIPTFCPCHAAQLQALCGPSSEYETSKAKKGELALRVMSLQHHAHRSSLSALVRCAVGEAHRRQCSGFLQWPHTVYQYKLWVVHCAKSSPPGSQHGSAGGARPRTRSYHTHTRTRVQYAHSRRRTPTSASLSTASP